MEIDTASVSMVIIAIAVVASIIYILVKNWPLYQKDINELMKMHDEDEW